MDFSIKMKNYIMQNKYMVQKLLVHIEMYSSCIIKFYVKLWQNKFISNIIKWTYNQLIMDKIMKQ